MPAMDLFKFILLYNIVHLQVHRISSWNATFTNNILSKLTWQIANNYSFLTPNFSYCKRQDNTQHLRRLKQLSSFEKPKSKFSILICTIKKR